jgi:arginine/lysine/ornithine decarboxylase
LLAPQNLKSILKVFRVVDGNKFDAKLYSREIETGCNPFGFIGGIGAHCFEGKYLRTEISKVVSEKATEERPFRLAVIKLGTYDGTIYNARQAGSR